MKKIIIFLLTMIPFFGLIVGTIKDYPYTNKPWFYFYHYFILVLIIFLSMTSCSKDDDDFYCIECQNMWYDIKDCGYTSDEAINVIEWYEKYSPNYWDCKILKIEDNE